MRKISYYSKSYYQELLQKRENFREVSGTKKQVFITFITNHGVTDNSYKPDVVDVEILLENLI